MYWSILIFCFIHFIVSNFLWLWLWQFCFGRRSTTTRFNTATLLWSIPASAVVSADLQTVQYIIKRVWFQYFHVFIQILFIAFFHQVKYLNLRLRVLSEKSYAMTGSKNDVKTGTLRNGVYTLAVLILCFWILFLGKISSFLPF